MISALTASLPGAVGIAGQRSFLMKRRFALPSAVELAILGTAAILVAVFCATDPGATRFLPVLLFPMVLAAMLMGARRTGQLAAAPQPAVSEAAKATEPSA
jgi:hypothetical protein